jgi:flagellar biosynthesis protein FliR
MFVNVVLGVISRIAPQTHIFSIGFPITMGIGLASLLFILPLMETPFIATLERMLDHFR